MCSRVSTQALYSIGAIESDKKKEYFACFRSTNESRFLQLIENKHEFFQATKFSDRQYGY